MTTTNRKAALSLFSILAVGIGMQGQAMNGIAVTCLGGAPTLTSYEITNNAVGTQKQLYSFTDGSGNVSQQISAPSINPSGTHVVCYRGWQSRLVDNRANHPELMIFSLTTGAGKVICRLDTAFTGWRPVWWLHDGSIVTWVGCDLVRYRLSKQGTTTTVQKSIFAKWDYKPEMQYVDISMDGRYISYRVYGTGCISAAKLSTQLVGPVPADPSVPLGPNTPGFVSACGCGNAVSPLGDRNACFQGSGHEGLTYMNTQANTKILTVNNLSDITAWCACNLSGTFGGTDFGQGWSVNSTTWSVVSLGCGSRETNNGADQFLVNIDERKVIDVTRYCATGSKNAAMRGDLWVSSQADVDAPLWQYVQNRDQYRAQWDDIMAGLPDSGAAPVGVRGRMQHASATSRVSVVYRPGQELLIRGRVLQADLYDSGGKSVRRSAPSSHGVAIGLAGLRAGRYLLRVRTPGSVAQQSTVLVR